MKHEYPMIEDEDHCNQFRTKKGAVEYAKMETRTLHLKHIVCKAITWRDMEPRSCWVAVMTRESV